MATNDIANVNIDPDLTRLQYGTGTGEVINIPALPGSVAITVINGATGPTIDIDGGTTGLFFATAGSTISLSGTLAIANGGTGATTVAGVLTALGLSKNNSAGGAPTVNDDSTQGYSINSLWFDTGGVKTYVCQSASPGAASWIVIAP